MKKLYFTISILLITFCSYAQLYQVPVYNATSLQPAQPGSEALYTIDNDNTTMYHSKWGQNGIPDELIFYFTSNVTSINKMVYTPRASGPNGIWTNVSIYYSTQIDPTNFILVTSNLNWLLNNLDKEVNLINDILSPYAIKFVVNAGSGNLSSCAEMKFYSVTQPVINDGVDCAIPATALSANGENDVEATITPAGSTASSFQSGENISASFDNDVSTLYHSSYNNTIFPVVLNYRLDGVTPIDYLKYIPRSDGGSNGNFGNITISYNTSGNSTFQLLNTLNLGLSGMPSIVQFPFQITPLNIQISVANGAGGFASCAEMEFYTADAANTSTPYTNVFANNLYSALLPTITQATIDTMSSPFYQSLAQCIFNGTYIDQYRVQSYQVYPTLNSISSTLKVGSYDPFENPTGIVFQQGEKAALFAQNIPFTTPVYLVVKDFATVLGGTVSYYLLNNGLNVFNISNNGLGYISYFNTDSTLADVELNIVSGKINGYFNAQISSVNEWPDLLSGNAYPLLDVVGKYAHLVYLKGALSSGSPFNPINLISKYDTIIQHERMMMGLYKYNISPKNHQLAYSNHGGGYYAGGIGVNLDVDWGSDGIANPTQLGYWGIAHEFGHINQIRPNLKWIGTTEVTNNIYTVWVDYNMNNGHHPYSRLEEEQIVPAAGIAAIEGGRINASIYKTYVNGEPLQDTAGYDVFKVLVPFWQLQLYYQLAGASRNAPILSFNYPQSYSGVDYAHWYGIVAETSRNTNAAGLTNGELLLNFVKNTCDAVQENLIPYFQNTGFLKPIDVPINDYGIGQLTITQTQIDSAIAYIQSKNYQAPVSPIINYISAHSINMFKNQLPLSGQTGIGVTLSNNYLTVLHNNWPNAVAYETYDANNLLIFVSISGTGDLSNQTTKVYYPNNALQVYAVGFDGQKILVYPATALSIESNKMNKSMSIYPNPVERNSPIHLVLKNAVGNYHATILSLEGRTIFTSNGTIENIEQTINRNFVNYQAGTYILCLIDAKQIQYRLKFTLK